MKDIAKKQAGFLEALRDASCIQYVEVTFLYAAAPILRGVKPSALITLRPQNITAWKRAQHSLCGETGLQVLEIMNKRGTALLFIYDEAALCKYLCGAKAQALLTWHGYPEGLDLNLLLQCLRERFAYNCFPHEIGAFLGYPIEDVRSFIENKGRNSICCRYWKVYHNIEKAQETFSQIDEAQSYAMDILINPMPVHAAARLLKTAG